MLNLKLAILTAVLLVIIVVSGSTHGAEANDDPQAPAFFMHLQFEVFSIDLKTETVYTSNYEFLLKARDPNTPNFTAVILKPSYYEAGTYLSGNDTGTSQIYDYLKINEPQSLEVNRWSLTRIQPLPPLGSPFDHFELSFLIAVNMSTRLELNDTWFIMPLSMQGDWSHGEQPPIVKLANFPDNQTLIAHGLNPDKFFQHNGENMTDFYLITETFTFPYMQSLRITVAYSIPSISILFVGLFSLSQFKRMKRSDFLTLYLGAGLFAFTFLVSFYQYAPSKVLTWQEIFLYVDFFFVTALAILAILFRKDGESSKNKEDKQRPKQAASSDTNAIPEKKDLDTQVLLAQISARENSTLVISTVAASASLAILAFVVQNGNVTRLDLAWIALLFSIAGFLYREVTIWSVEREDYAILNDEVPSYRRNLNRRQKAFVFARMCLVRFLLLLPLTTWLLIMCPSQPVMSAVAMVSGVGFFSLLEYCLRYDP
jgi:hypothetical protein